jgi:hypothetical protein
MATAEFVPDSPGQALHGGDVTGPQPVLALISAYQDIFGD